MSCGLFPDCHYLTFRACPEYPGPGAESGPHHQHLTLKQRAEEALRSLEMPGFVASECQPLSLQHPLFATPNPWNFKT